MPQTQTPRRPSDEEVRVEMNKKAKARRGAVAEMEVVNKALLDNLKRLKGAQTTDSNQ